MCCPGDSICDPVCAHICAHHCASIQVCARHCASMQNCDAQRGPCGRLPDFNMDTSSSVTGSCDRHTMLLCCLVSNGRNLPGPAPSATVARQSWLVVASTCCLALWASLAEAVEGVRVVLAVLGLFSQSQKVLRHLPSVPAVPAAKSAGTHSQTQHERQPSTGR